MPTQVWEIRTVFTAPGAGKTAADIKGVGTAAAGAGNQVKDTAKQFHNLAGAFVSMLGARYLAGMFSGLVTPALQLESSMLRLKAATSANEETMAKFQERAIQVAAITPYGVKQMVDAMTQLRMATGDSDAASKALEGTAQLAMASFGKVSVEQSAKMVGEAIKSFHMTGEEATNSMGKLLGIARASGTELSEYSGVIGKLGAGAVRAGQSFDDMAAAFALARPYLGSATRTATLLGSAMGSLSDPKAVSTLRQFGVEIKDRTTGNMRSIVDIAQDLSVAYTSSGQEVRDSLNRGLGEQTVKPLIAMAARLADGFTTASGTMVQGADAVQYLKESMGQKGLLKEMSDLYSTSTSGSLDIFKQSIQDMGILLGQSLLPALGAVVRTLTPIANTINYILSSDVGKFFATAVFSVGALGAAWLAVKMMLFGVHRLTLVILSNLVASAGAATAAATAAAGAGGVGAAGGMVGGTVLGMFKTLIWQTVKSIAAFVLGPWGLAAAAGIATITALGLYSERKAKEYADRAKVDLLQPMATFNTEAVNSIRTMAIASGTIKDNLTMASQALQDAVKEHTKMVAFKFPEVKIGAYESVISNLEKGLDKVKSPADAAAIQSVLRAAPTVRELGEKALAGTATPSEYKHLENLVTKSQVVTRFIAQRYKGGVVSTGAADLMEKGFSNPMLQMASPENQKATEIYTQASGGRSAAGTGSEMISKSYAPWLGRMSGLLGMLTGSPATEDVGFLPENKGSFLGRNYGIPSEVSLRTNNIEDIKQLAHSRDYISQFEKTSPEQAKFDASMQKLLTELSDVGKELRTEMKRGLIIRSESPGDPGAGPANGGLMSPQ